MVLPDTSIFLNVFRDASGDDADFLFSEIGDRDIVTTRVVEMELLAGAKDERECNSLRAFVASLPMLDHNSEVWEAAARMFFDLQRDGVTVRKLADYYIARIAIENDALLIHDDRDFEKISIVRPLTQKLLDLRRGPPLP